MSLISILEDLAEIEVDSISGVTVDQIVQAESVIGIKIPKSYQKYLLRFGAAMFEDNYEIFGLPDSSKYDDAPPIFSNLIEETQRYIGQEGFEGMIHILHNGCSDAYFLDTLSGTEDECPVVLCNPSVDV